MSFTAALWQNNTAFSSIVQCYKSAVSMAIIDKEIKHKTKE